MPNNMKIFFDGQEYEAELGQTVLEAARANGIHIDTLCNHPDIPAAPNCRVCVVEIKGRDGLYTACSTQIVDGMQILTDSPAIKRARKTNMELIFAQHVEECNDCVYRYNCLIKNLAVKYGVQITRFSDRKKDFPVYEFGPALQFDSSKCIDCGICIEICKRQGVNFLELELKNNFYGVTCSKKPGVDCIYCGQCLVHCPVGAFEAIGEYEEVEKPLQDKTKTVVFQFAPSIRASIGEEFGMPHGSVVTGQLAAGIRKLGANAVFDVAVGADITTMVEAQELVERLQSGKNLPMFTGCCPAWVKYVEFFYPELIPNLTTARSPQLITAGLIKTYWAKKMNIDPKNIVVVSVMPCVAKKYEMTRPELRVDGQQLIDYVFTTRELAFLFHKHKIDLKTIRPENCDEPLGDPTGAGVIYGASGGVMESALRTAYYQLTGEDLPKLDLIPVRGQNDVKRASVTIGGKQIKVAVVNGNGNALKILEELKKDPQAYHYVEVMACPGGCIGGGGQPVPTNAEVRAQRAAALYTIDQSKMIRTAHGNPEIDDLFKTFFADEETLHKICHTKYFKKEKEVNY